MIPLWLAQPAIQLEGFTCSLHSAHKMAADHAQSPVSTGLDRRPIEVWRNRKRPSSPAPGVALAAGPGVKASPAELLERLESTCRTTWAVGR